MQNLILDTPETHSGRRPRRRCGDYTIGKHNLPTCPDTGKVRYRDRAQASEGLRSAKWRRLHDVADGVDSRRRETRSYKCPECSGWHNTSIATWVDMGRQLLSASA